MIGRLLLAGVAAGALTCGAAAADLPVAPGPSYYPGAVTPVPYYNWSGVYVGANAGGAWVSQPSSVTTDVPTATVVATPSWQSKDFAGGGQIGANWFFYPSYMLGVEADFDALTGKSSVLSFDGTNRQDNRLKYLSTLRARFGLTADRFMIYATAGGAWGRNEITRTQVTGTANGAIPGTIETIEKNRFGWSAGAGVEYAITQAWTARLEYIYSQLGGVTYTFPLARRTTATNAEGVNELRIGVNYKFGLGGPLAVRD